MSEDQFTKLFKHMTDEFSAVQKRFDQQDKKIDDVLSSTDGIAGQLKDYHQEMIMLAHKVDRLEQWILKIAEETGVKLSS